jgi:hopanoid biosynthesis associated protein HpnK
VRRSALIITADDFGLHECVNQAVERAHVDGVLSAASLMVGAPAAADAVARAHRLPRLRVGLHLVLADGWSTLLPAQIPDLVDANRRFADAMVRDGFRFFFSRRVRRQLAAEIRAQFEAFAATGLVLDHVNAHKHFHLHPTVLGLMLDIGRDFGLAAVRVPWEPGTAPWLAPWIGLMRARLRRAGVAYNDAVIGIARSGAMDEPALLDALAHLRPGVTEIYLHPATIGGAAIAPTMSGYRHDAELAALLSPRVRQASEAAARLRGGYRDLFPPA